ncbi:MULTISPECIES: hypothetical protein [unclassified Bartonella]|uniref:hypothetical protein n=1 Tax=unclassified Bartonella TaxID=2645622 RepID=UPI0015FDEC60|nr:MULTISPECIES: hypothetical protein [unclassified Bartonella]UXN04967.1 hypothetical protein N6B01_13895 [Bartonella sp. HY406]
MQFVSKLFKSIDAAYLVRSYVIGAIWAAIFISMVFVLNKSGSMPIYGIITMIVVYLINFLLFPFAKFVWDSIKDLFLGNYSFKFSFLLWLGLVVPAKIIVNMLLFSAAILIAPIGIIYLALTNRGREQDLAS